VAQINRVALFVLHGFNSTGDTDKATFLRQHLPEVDVDSPTYHHDPRLAGPALQARVENVIAGRAPVPVFFGTSLGAFYARFLAHRYDGRAILVNPVQDAVATLAPALGPNTNVKTGVRYLFERVHLEAFTEYRVDAAAPDPPTLVLLDMADELLDSRATARFFEARPNVRVIRFAGGEHRFAHLPEALPEIRRHLPG